MNTRHVKRICAIVGGLILIGSTLTACGISKVQYTDLQAQDLAKAKQIDEQAQQLAELQIKATNSDMAAQLATDKNTVLTDELTKTKLILDEKDKLILEDAKEEAEKLAQETSANSIVKEEYDNLDLGAMVPDKTFDTYDLAFLDKSKVKFDGESYDFKETISLSNLKVGTVFDDEEFKDNAYLLFTERGGVRYDYTFIDPIPYTGITEKEEVAITFLGQDIQIIAADADSIKIKEPVTTKIMKQGDILEIAGHTVELKYVGTKDVLVGVDGEEYEAIDELESYDFDGFEVRVKDTFYSDSVQLAKLEFGTDIVKTIENGDEYIEDNDEYLWTIRTVGDDLISIGITYDVKADDMDEPILGTGKNLNFLGYFDTAFNLEKDDYNYVKYTFGFDEIMDPDMPVAYVKTNTDSIRVNGEKLKEVYFDAVNVYYKDGSDWITVPGTVKLENGDSLTEVNYDGTRISMLGGDVELYTSDLIKLGALEEEAEAGDVVINGEAFGRYDDNAMYKGYRFDSIESNADQDEFVMYMPDEDVKAVIQITG